MANKYNKIETEALDSKERTPESVVICPRCGKELIFEDYGCAYVIKCPMENCIKRTVRGI